MGVLNITPDSFSDGGRYLDPEKALERAVRMFEEGADIIDIGGESSRPGSIAITAEEESARIIPAIKAIKKRLDVPLSVDTYKSEVARQALEEGATIINDISALRMDPEMASVVADFDAGLVLMHMKGIPKTMQEEPSYDDVVSEVYEYLSEAIDAAEAAGVGPDKIVVDPGIGFGKRIEHNLSLLRNLRELEGLGKPLLVGTSRKSFIGEVTSKGVEERIFGTAASVAFAVMNGASVVRVHDVGPMKDVVKVIDAIRKES
jgi:dihydropteroate synthase